MPEICESLKRVMPEHIQDDFRSAEPKGTDANLSLTGDVSGKRKLVPRQLADLKGYGNWSEMKQAESREKRRSISSFPWVSACFL